MRLWHSIRQSLWEGGFSERSAPDLVEALNFTYTGNKTAHLPDNGEEVGCEKRS